MPDVGLAIPEGADHPTPKKPKPVLSIDLEDIEGIGDVQVEDRLKLEIVVRVGQVSKPPGSDFTGTMMDVLKTKFVDSMGKSGGSGDSDA